MWFPAWGVQFNYKPHSWSADLKYSLSILCTHVDETWKTAVILSIRKRLSKTPPQKVKGKDMKPMYEWETEQQIGRPWAVMVNGVAVSISGDQNNALLLLTFLQLLHIVWSETPTHTYHVSLNAFYTKTKKLTNLWPLMLFLPLLYQ